MRVVLVIEVNESRVVPHVRVESIAPSEYARAETENLDEAKAANAVIGKVIAFADGIRDEP